MPSVFIVSRRGRIKGTNHADQGSLGFRLSQGSPDVAVLILYFSGSTQRKTKYFLGVEEWEVSLLTEDTE